MPTHARLRCAGHPQGKARHHACLGVGEGDRPARSMHSRLGPNHDGRNTAHRSARRDDRNDSHDDSDDSRIIGQHRSLTPLGTVYAGPKVFGPCIRNVVFPPWFGVTDSDKYTGETRPDIWLASYHTTCRTNEDHDYIVIHYLPLHHLADSAQSWLTNPS